MCGACASGSGATPEKHFGVANDGTERQVLGNHAHDFVDGPRLEFFRLVTVETV